MLTASENIMQEEWVQRWFDKLTPKQRALVTEVLTDSSKYRKAPRSAPTRTEMRAMISESTATNSRLA